MTELVVVLHFDPATEGRLRDLQGILRLNGMKPESGVSYSRPHITLATLKGIPPDELAEQLQMFVRDETHLHVSLDAVGTFPGSKGTVYVAPVVTGKLLTLQKRLLENLSRRNVLFDDYYRPGRWMPHCSIAVNLPEAQIPMAIDLCRKSDVFGPARLVEIASVEYPVVVEVGSYALGNQNRPAKGDRA